MTEEKANLMIIEARNHRFWGPKTVWMASDNIEALQAMVTSATGQSGEVGEIYELGGKDSTPYYMVQLEHYERATLRHVKADHPSAETFHCKYSMTDLRDKIRDVLDMRRGLEPLPLVFGGLVEVAADRGEALGYHTLMLNLERNRAAQACVDGCDVEVPRLG